MERATSTGVPIGKGNETLIADVLNVYTDGATDGYVASNSLPSYDIDINVIEESFIGAGNSSNFDGFVEVNNLYSFIRFPGNSGIDLIQGDAVVYQPDGELIVGLSSGTIYYVDPQQEPAGQTIQRIALYNSRSQIGTASTVLVGIGSTTVGSHSFVLQRHSNRKLEADQILRRIPLSQNLFVSTEHETPVNDIGILKDGVQIHSPISDDNIFFGSLEEVQVLNSGDGYDVLNPPQIVVESSGGLTALV